MPSLSAFRQQFPDAADISDDALIASAKAQGLSLWSDTPAEPEPDAPSTLGTYLDTIGQGIKGVPSYIASAVEGATPYSENNALDQYQAQQQRANEAFVNGPGANAPVLGGMATAGDVRQAAGSLSGSIAGMAPSAIGAGIGSAFGPVGTAVGSLLGSGVGYLMMDRAAENQFVRDKVGQQPNLTPEQALELQNKLNASGDTARVGLAEAGPEALGNLAEIGIMATPAGRLFNSVGLLASPLKRAALTGLGKFGASMATEQAEEQVTRALTNPVYERNDMPTSSALDTAKQTAIATLPFGGLAGGVGAVQGYRAQPPAATGDALSQTLQDVNRETSTLTGGAVGDDLSTLLEEKRQATYEPITVTQSLDDLAGATGNDAASLSTAGTLDSGAIPTPFTPEPDVNAGLGESELPSGDSLNAEQTMVLGTATASTAESPSDNDALPDIDPTAPLFATEEILQPSADTPENTLPQSDIDLAAHEAATSPLNELTEPTDAQKEVGNYKKGKIRLQGLDIAIENPKGSTRSGVDAEGNAWSNDLAHHYGYIKRTVGNDGDQVDVFIGDNPESEQVFVVNQKDPKTGAFDEHKVMLGFNTKSEAREGYLKNYAKDWRGIQSVESMPMSEFKAHIKTGRFDKPLKASKGIDQTLEMTDSAVDMPVREVALDQLALSNDVPQFKSGSNKDGVVEALGGKFERTGVAPVQVWERTNGKLELISGRHRADLARRSGEATIPAQVHREADGFSAQQAATLDAELNIRDGQGKTSDYTTYFKASGLTEQDAKQRGLTSRTLRKTAFAIARDGADDLIAAHRNEAISDKAAYTIATIAPKNERIQALGMKAAMAGTPDNYVANLMQAVSMNQSPESRTNDLFGFDDSAIQEAESMAAIATEEQQRLVKLRNAAKIGAKAESIQGDTAGQVRVKIKNPSQLKAYIEQLDGQIKAWENWPTNPQLVSQIKAQRGAGESDLAPYTNADIVEREAQTKKQADQSAEESKKAEVLRQDQASGVDVFDEMMGNVPRTDDVFGMTNPMQKVERAETPGIKFSQKAIPAPAWAETMIDIDNGQGVTEQQSARELLAIADNKVSAYDAFIKCVRG